MIRLGRMVSGVGRVRGREEGYSLPELLVAIVVGTMVLGGLFTMINFTVRSNARTTGRVAVDQEARPAMQRIIDELHSTCVYPGLAPVQAGSTNNQLIMLHATGTAASPTPVLRKITYSGTNTSPSALTDQVFNYTTGTAPNWRFATYPSSSFTLLRQVQPVKTGTTYTPIFRYYKYVNGAISTTPLPASAPTGLSAENAKLVVQVTVTFQASLDGADKIDVNNPAVYSGNALLRFSPSNEDTNKAGLPCT